jgi:DNA-binding XRE family transcriptional regulator
MMDNRARQAQVGRMRRRAGASSLPPSRRAAKHERERTAGSRCSSRRLNAEARRTRDRTRIAAPTCPLSVSSGSAREQKNLTQATLAPRGEAPWCSLAKIEGNTLSPTLATLDQIAHVLGVPATELP